MKIFCKNDSYRSMYDRYLFSINSINFDKQFNSINDIYIYLKNLYDKKSIDKDNVVHILDIDKNFDKEVLSNKKYINGTLCVSQHANGDIGITFETKWCDYSKEQIYYMPPLVLFIGK